MEINTVLVNADYDSFSAAFKRSVLGVSYSKYKRKRGDFFQHRIENETITDLTIETLYTRIKKQIIGDAKNYKIKTSYTIEWDSEGKIIEFNKININILIDYGILLINKINTEVRAEPVNINLFTSDFDLVGKEIKKMIEKVKIDYGENNIIFKEYNLSNTSDLDVAKTFKVIGAPTVCIDEYKLENPKEKDILNILTKLKLSKINIEGESFVRTNEELKIEKIVPT
jgi:hypothetical protein